MVLGKYTKKESDLIERFDGASLRSEGWENYKLTMCKPGVRTVEEGQVGKKGFTTFFSLGNWNKASVAKS